MSRRESNTISGFNEKDEDQKPKQKDLILLSESEKNSPAKNQEPNKAPNSKKEEKSGSTQNLNQKGHTITNIINNNNINNFIINDPKAAATLIQGAASQNPKSST